MEVDKITAALWQKEIERIDMTIAICVSCKKHNKIEECHHCYAHANVESYDYVAGVNIYNNVQACSDWNNKGKCSDYEPLSVPNIPNPPPPPENATRAKNSQLINDMISNVAELHENLDKLIDIMLEG